MPTWMIYAFVGAVCAASVSVLGKKGLEHVPPVAATAVRSVVMAAFLIVVALLAGQASAVRQIQARAIGWIVLSGVGGALSWLFMFKALSLAEVRQVMPVDKLSLPLGVVLAAVLLAERPSALNWAGIALMTAGAMLATWKT